MRGLPKVQLRAQCLKAGHGRAKVKMKLKLKLPLEKPDSKDLQ